MTANLIAANRRRTQAAAPIQVAKARQAIRIIRNIKPRNAREEMMQWDYISVLLARVERPWLTLTLIADDMGMSKDAYWSTLRRAFEYAEKRGMTNA
jgi:hypothetical protein